MADEKKTDVSSGLGGIFGGLGKLLEIAQELQKQTGANNGTGQNSETTFTTPSGLSGVFGVNIRSVNGEARVEPFGNVVSSERGPSVDSVREPLTDLLEEDTQYTVIVELPGVDANSIKVNLEGQILHISASGAGQRQYAKQLELSRVVNGDAIRRSYQNGILELTLPFA
jgi:HSP20 family protein